MKSPELTFCWSAFNSVVYFFTGAMRRTSARKEFNTLSWMIRTDSDILKVYMRVCIYIYIYSFIYFLNLLHALQIATNN